MIVPRIALIVMLLMTLTGIAAAQKKKKKANPKAKAAPVQAEDDLSRLRNEYLKSSKEYKASLQRLIVLYQKDVDKAEQRVQQVRKLFADGLVSKREVEDSEETLRAANLQVSGVQTQISGADTQIAQTLLEVEGEKQMARLGPVPKGRVMRTAAYIRYNGVGGWMLSQASKIESFFQQTFKHPLPIAVFGQGAIHNQWRLDHRNAMDISLHPDGPEGQALVNYLQANGIPFSAFRMAIPGVATGPHIHIGLPSHRY